MRLNLEESHPAAVTAPNTKCMPADENILQPGQESVWDYPRPPLVEPEPRHVLIEVDGEQIASSHAALRVLETSHPPTIYLPLEDVAEGVLTQAPGSSYCEWKGRAAYWDVSVGGRTIKSAAWSYPNPNRRYRDLQGHISFYPGKMDACYLGGELVAAQPGDFYGGWITSEIVGPFKGGPGTMGW